MIKPIKYVLILTKVNNRKAKELGDNIKVWLRERNIECEVLSTDAFEGSKQFEKKPDFLIVLGGDGTVLSTVHKLNVDDLFIPILGFNLGRVGFLTTSEPELWEETIEDVINGRFNLISYMMLNYTLFREGRKIEQGSVVNDIVISRYGIARLMELQVWYDGVELGKIRADGLIVTTPLGSTAYAWAAGGALIDPDLKVFEICPVCQFLTNIKPLILPSHKTLKIKILSPLKDFILTLDGQRGLLLNSKDIIEVKEAKEVIYFIQTKSVPYIERLKAKGYI